MVRLGELRVAAVALLILAPVLCGSRQAAATTVLAEPPAGEMYVGVFPGGHNGRGSDITPDQVDTYARATGKRPAWVYFWNNWYEGRAFPQQTAEWIRASGSVPYIRLMLMHNPIRAPDPEYSLDRILEGRLDADLRAWMQAARRFSTPLVAEYGVEVNGWWFPWNGLWNRRNSSYIVAVDKFRRAYRHLIAIAREQGARNIRWVFHVDPWDEPAEFWNRFENYYPGDDWIDWVGVSVYGRQVPNDRRAISFRYQMDWAYGRLRRLTRKAVIVCEFGTLRDAVQARWAAAALDDLTGGRWPRVIGFSWWNTAFYNDPVHSRRRSDMRVEDSAALAAVFRRYAGRNPRVLSVPVIASR